MSVRKDILGNYRLLRLIRAGQTCQIWESFDLRDERRLAVKTPVPDHRENPDEIAYLKHEAEVASDFKHPNLIEVYEFNMDRNYPFLALEFFNSKNMKQTLDKKGHAYLHLATEILSGAAEALRYMHEQGWVHCDVKPDNFLVAPTGEVKLIDFAISQKPKTGLAALFGGKKKVQGTRSYMSPEQIQGKNIDHRADIYSLGCVMYEFLTGKPPYTGVNPDELLVKHIKATIPQVMVANPDLTPEINSLIMKMMAKSKEDRPMQMKDLAKEIRNTNIFRVGKRPTAPTKTFES